MQNALSILYPSQCASCGVFVEADHALCGACWAQTPFIEGLVCDACGVPIVGEPDNRPELCDDCLRDPPNWTRGRSAMLYSDVARKLILAFKHGDRLDLARPMGNWLARSVPVFVPDGPLVVPVPLHWTRLAMRRFNQSALLARHLGNDASLEVKTDVLYRTRRTLSQEGRTKHQRRENLAGCMAVSPSRAELVEGRNILVVDDVMTSGATFTEATRALLEAGASHVFVVSIARVEKPA